MRFAIWPSPERTWDEILELTRHCEATGWDGVYFADHFMPNSPDGGPTPMDGNTLECWSVIAALAATVPRLRLSPLVTSVTYRHPAVLAKIAAAVDNISDGRLLLGIGAGWQENEHAAYGIELGTVKERLDRFEEACAVISSMTRERRTTFAGSYFRVTDAPNQPPPVQSPLPLLVGGSGERRTMRIAAQYADEWNAWTTPDLLAHKVGVLHRHCEDLGRDPEEMRVSTQALLFLSNDESWLSGKRSSDVGRAAIVGTPSEVVDIVGRYRDAGADELIVRTSPSAAWSVARRPATSSWPRSRPSSARRRRRPAALDPPHRKLTACGHASEAIRVSCARSAVIWRQIRETTTLHAHQMQATSRHCQDSAAECDLRPQ